MLFKLDRAVVKAEVVVACLILAAITVIVFLQVLYRYVLLSPLAWTDELSRYLQVWLTFIGGSIGIQRAAHFHLDIIHHIIPKRFLGVLGFAVDAAMLLFVALLAYNGTGLLEIVARQKSPALDVTMSYAYLGIPVGCSLAVFHLVVRLIGRVLPGAGPEAAEGKEVGQ